MLSSVSSKFLQELRNEIPDPDDDFFDDEIMTYDLFLDVAKFESWEKDEKVDIFHNSRIYKTIEGKMFSINRKDILASRASLIQNFTASYSKRIIDLNKMTIFNTATIDKPQRLEANKDISYAENILFQHNIFAYYRRHIRYDKHNRNMSFFNSFELHKKGDLHLHSLDSIPDTFENLITYIKVVSRAKKSKGVGRIEVRIPYKYKTDLIKYFSLKSKGGLYFVDYNEFKTGSALLFTFFQPDRDSYKDIVAYMMKYTQKSLAYSDKKSNEYYVFRKLGIRAFTYSRGILPSLLAYQKVRYQLIQRDKRYADLYELQCDIDKGLVSFETEYEKIDPEYIEHYRKSVIDVDFHIQDEPIVYKRLTSSRILLSKEHYILKAVQVSFSDGSNISWSSGGYEIISSSEIIEK